MGVSVDEAWEQQLSCAVHHLSISGGEAFAYSGYLFALQKNVSPPFSFGRDYRSISQQRFHKQTLLTVEFIFSISQIVLDIQCTFT